MTATKISTRGTGTVGRWIDEGNEWSRRLKISPVNAFSCWRYRFHPETFPKCLSSRLSAVTSCLCLDNRLTRTSKWQPSSFTSLPGLPWPVMKATCLRASDGEGPSLDHVVPTTAGVLSSRWWRLDSRKCFQRKWIIKELLRGGASKNILRTRSFNKTWRKL